MGLAYQDIADTLNTKLSKGAVKQAARDFQNQHGPKGHGDGGLKKPYRFGNFATTIPGVVDPAKEAKWLIDTGQRNWDVASVQHLQEVIRQNLSDDGAQIPMKFKIVQGTAAKARADCVQKTDPVDGDYWEVTLTCRTEPT